MKIFDLRKIRSQCIYTRTRARALQKNSAFFTSELWVLRVRASNFSNTCSALSGIKNFFIPYFPSTFHMGPKSPNLLVVVLPMWPWRPFEVFWPVKRDFPEIFEALYLWNQMTWKHAKWCSGHHLRCTWRLCCWKKNSEFFINNLLLPLAKLQTLKSDLAPTSYVGLDAYMEPSDH